MVTGYEDDNGFWWVGACRAQDCRRTHVGRGYRGPNRDNFHYYTRCRPPSDADLRVVNVKGRVQAATSGGPNAFWNDVWASDLLAPGTVLLMSSGAEVHWQRTPPRCDAGVLRASDAARYVLVEATSFECIDSNGG